MGVNIDIYLRNAFKELDAFSLPNIGTFRKVHLSARVDEKYQKVYPPRVEIEFSPQADTRLSFSRYLTSQIQMPQDEADRIVSDICNDIERLVREQGQFHLPDIGSIFLDSKQQYAFSPDPNSREIFSGEFFGLKAVELSSIPEEPQNIVPVETEDKSMTQTTHSSETTPKNRRSGYSALTLLLIVLILGTGGVFLWQNQALTRSSIQNDNYLSIVSSDDASQDFLADNVEIENFEEKEAQPAANATSRLTDNAQAKEKNTSTPSKKETLPSSTQPNPSTNPVARTSPPPTQNTRGMESQGLPRGAGSSTDDASNIKELDKSTARLAPGSSTYHLITGSFAKAASAEKFKSQLLKEGFKKVEILHAPDLGKYRVSVFSSTSAKEVKIFQSNLKDQGRGAGWILEEK